MELTRMESQKIFVELKALRVRERECVTEILKYLAEIERRKLHLERGFSSLYSFCIEELGYSEDEAYIRIQAMRCMVAVPQVQQKIEAGEISLTVVAKAQKVFRQQQKLQQPLSKNAKSEVIESLLCVTSREADKKLATQFPEAIVVHEKIKPISEDLTKVEFTANKRLMEKLDRLKGLLAHKNFDGRMDILIEQLADIALKKLDPCQEQPKKTPAVRPVSNGKSRSVPRPIRTKIWKSADSQCQYIDLHTGKRCTCRHGLQIDHKIPFSRGGTTDLLNLQLLCGAHNRWKSDRLSISRQA